MDYKIIADNIQITGALTDGYPDHITNISIILQGSFEHDGRQHSVEAHGQTGFNPTVAYSDLMPNIEEVGFELAEANGWFSVLEEREAEILKRPIRFRPEFSISKDGEKGIDTEEKFDRLAKAVSKDEVLDAKGVQRRSDRKTRDKKSIRDRIAAKIAKKEEDRIALEEEAARLALEEELPESP